jgi:hypothetical protein
LGSIGYMTANRLSAYSSILGRWCLLGVLDGQRVQTELLGHRMKFGVFGLE